MFLKLLFIIMFLKCFMNKLYFIINKIIVDYSKINHFKIFLDDINQKFIQ